MTDKFEWSMGPLTAEDVDKRIKGEAWEMYKTLDHLVKTKEYKEEHGKDAVYEEARSTAWAEAEKVLAQIRGEEQ
jgi:hypothetical protein